MQALRFCLTNLQEEQMVGSSERWHAVMVVDSKLQEINLSKVLGTQLYGGLTWNVRIDSLCARLGFGIYVLRFLAKQYPIKVLRNIWPNLPTYFLW